MNTVNPLPFLDLNIFFKDFHQFLSYTCMKSPWYFLTHFATAKILRGRKFWGLKFREYLLRWYILEFHTSKV